MASDLAPLRRAFARLRFTWVLGVALVLFMALVVYRSFYVAGFRCAVCIAFDGRSECRTVEGPTERDALMGATTNACALLSSGVTDTIACERTAPTSAKCTPIE
jgi:hypothetical protein